MSEVKKINISTTRISLSIKLPSSKSISNRALVLNALSYSPYAIENLAECDDTDVMVKVFESNNNVFDIGAAGTAMRFLTAFLSKTVGEWVITGSERMKNRPIKILVDALNSLGAKVEYAGNEGFPPLRIFGSALMGGEIKLDGGISSQYISALMMIAPSMVNGLKIKLEGNIISVPYIKMTQKIMEDFGVKMTYENNQIDIRPQAYRPVKYQVESDWSAASYWYEILSIVGNGEIELLGLKKNSTQGDSRVAILFEQLGVNTKFTKNGIIITSSNTYNDKFEYNFVNEPDLAQTFAVSCCLKNIPFLFKGLQSLKIKETNRIQALITELKKLGYVLNEPTNGELVWDGTRCETLSEIKISTYDDHRMAMAFAPVGLMQSIQIEHPQVVSKSYPNFWDDFEKIK